MRTHTNLSPQGSAKRYGRIGSSAPAPNGSATSERAGWFHRKLSATGGVSKTLLAIVVLATSSFVSTPVDAAGDVNNPVYNPVGVWDPPEVAPPSLEEPLQVGNVSLPVERYAAVAADVWSVPGRGYFLSGIEGNPIGQSYYLPFTPNTVTIMKLPIEEGADSFLTENMCGCGFIVGENAAGEAVAMHINAQAATTPIADAYSDAHEAAVDTFSEIPGNADEPYTQAELIDADPSLVAAETAYVDGVQAFFESVKQAAVSAEIVTEDAALLTSTAVDGKTKFISGTRTEDGWNFRSGQKGPNEDDPVVVTELAQNVGSTNVQAPLPAATAEEEQDHAETESVEALENAEEAVSNVGSDIHADGATVETALQVGGQVDRIWDGLNMPPAVEEAIEGLDTALDAAGVERGSDVSARVVGGFEDVAEGNDEVAARMHWSDVWTDEGPVLRGFEYAGRAFLVVGLATTAWTILHADNKALEAASQAGGWAGAIAAGWRAGSATEAALAYFDVAGPFAWIATTTASVVAGGIGFAAGYYVGNKFYYMVEHPMNGGTLSQDLRQLHTVPSPTRTAAADIMAKYDPIANVVLTYDPYDTGVNFMTDEWVYLSEFSGGAGNTVLFEPGVEAALEAGLMTFETGEIAPTSATSVFANQDVSLDGYLDYATEVADEFTTSQYAYIADLETRSDRSRLISPWDVRWGLILGLLQVEDNRLRPVL